MICRREEEIGGGKLKIIGIETGLESTILEVLNSLNLMPKKPTQGPLWLPKPFIMLANQETHNIDFLTIMLQA